MSEHDKPKPLKPIKTVVPFAASNKPTYEHDYPPDSTAQTIVTDALAYYEVHPDGTSRYYLVFDGAEVSPTTTVGSLAEEKHEIKLKLRTETTSG